MSPGNIRGKMARGAMWMVLLTFVDRSLGLVSTLILARILAPADFGIVAMALSFIFLAQLLSRFGFDVALIHNKDATEAHYHTAWTFNVLLGFAILLLALAAAAPIADFYHEPDVFWIVCALAFWPFIGGCENIGVVAFRKDLDFDKEFRFQISRRLIGFAVTVPLALWLRNHWALVIGTLATRLAGTVTSYLMHPFRPRLSLAEAPSLFGFSRWLLFNNVLGFLKERLSDFAIGRLSGPAALGLYNISYEFSNLPTTEIGAPINRALLPGFAKLTDPTTVQATYVSSMGMLAIVAIPAAAGILAVAPFFMPVVLGTKWIDGVPLMEVLSASGAVIMFQASIAAVLVAKGHPAAVTRTNLWFVLLLSIFLLGFAPTFGALGAAYAVLLTAVLTTPFYLRQMRRYVGVPMLAFARAVVRPALAACAMVLVVRAVLPEYSTSMPEVDAMLWLMGGVVVGFVAYAAILAVLWLVTGRPAGAEQLLLDQLRVGLARVFSRPRDAGTDDSAAGP